MNRSRVKFSLFKSLPITAGTFILSIVLSAVGTIIDGGLIDPWNILVIFGMFIIIGVVNFFRVFIDDSKWARSKPSVIKNFIFAPIYFTLAMVYAVYATGGVYFPVLLGMGLLFLAVFMIMQTVTYFVAKKKTDQMNDALKIFLKEHEVNEK
jgi:hypothetical protein